MKYFIFIVFIFNHYGNLIILFLFIKFAASSKNWILSQTRNRWLKEQNGQKTSTIKMIISVGKKLMGVGIWRRQEQERVQRIESWRCFLAVWFILTEFVPLLWISETTMSLEMFWINRAISIKKIFFHHVIRYCIITLFQSRSCVYIYLRGNC